MNIIGITGLAGSGKDTVASYLSSTYTNTWVESFADPLKRACAAATGISFDSFNDREDKELTDHRWDKSPRELAQFVGTEMFRNMIREDFWVYRMHLLLTGEITSESGAIYDADDTIVIPDVRFQNELDYLLDKGALIIRLTKDGSNGIVGIPGHASEAGITRPEDYLTFYDVSNNGTKEDLYEEVEQVLTESQIILFQTQTVQRTFISKY